MNAQLRHVAVACGLLFGLLLVNATYLQGVRAEELRNRDGNARVLYEEYDRERGPIVVSEQAVAFSRATEDQLTYKRVYRSGKLYAHATGYYSLFTSTGIEGELDEVLAGTDERFFVRRMVNLATGKKPQGGTAVLTLNARAQRAAHSQLAGREGAAVALDPQTGAIRAMVSTPAYNPNRLAAHDSGKVRQAYRNLKQKESRPLLNRAIGETYFPGSTFKVVTAAAALSSGNYQPSTQVNAPEELDLPKTGATLQNYAGGGCSPTGQMPLADALRTSCNTAFGDLGMKLGSTALSEQARKFGFGDTFTVPMESAPSNFPEGINAPQTAQSAIGQYDVKATPLQMAMVAAAVANDGTVMRPHLVDEIQGPNLATIERTEPEEYGEAVSPEVAGQLTRMMTGVVQSGTGTAAQIPGVAVAGKTGTAQQGPGEPDHAWFISFAPANDPQVAVAVVVPNSGETGGGAAAPIAKNVLQAVLQQ